MEISNKNQRRFSYHDWLGAKSMVENGLIQQMHVEKSNQHYWVDAKFSSYYASGHSTWISLDETGELIEFSCTCPDCIKNRVVCCHVGGVLLTLRDLDIDSFPYDYDYEVQRARLQRKKELENHVEDTLSLINEVKESFGHDFITVTDEKDVDIYATLSKDYHTLSVEFKVGKKKMYVIKNCRNFLNRLNDGQYYEFGKELKFAQKWENFSEMGQKTIAFMRSATDEEMSYDEREITLDNNLLDYFFNLYVNNQQYININLVEKEEEKVKMIAQKEEGFTIFSMDEEEQTDFYFGADYLYSFSHNTLIRYSKAYSKAMMSFLRFFKDKKEIVVNQTNRAEFDKYILSFVAPYLDVLSIDDDLQMPESYMVEVYLDLDDKDDVLIKPYAIDNEGKKHHLFAEDVNSVLVDQVMNTIREKCDVVDTTNNEGVITNTAKGHQFINEVIPLLQNHCHVYVSDSIKKLVNPKKTNISVGVTMNNGLLEVSLSSIDIPADEIAKVLKSYKHKKKYHRLKNGEVIDLTSPDFEEVDSMLDDLDIKLTDSNEYNVDNYRLFELNQLDKDYETLNIDRSDLFKETMAKFKQVDSKSYQIPEGIKADMRDYQIEGFRWLKTMQDYNMGAILADDMGLGKTLEMICVIKDNKDKGGALPSLVICPASLILNWKDECAKFCPDLRTCCITGNPASRQYLIDQNKDFDLLITSYDYLRKDVDAYSNLVFENIILDEGQNIKNHTTKNANVVKQLKGLHKFVLTGTPIENSLAELWSIFDFLMPGYLYNYNFFKTYYERPIIKEEDEQTQEKLKRLVEPFILRRVKKEVLKELPDKFEQEIMIDFSEEEKKVYIANLALINKELNEQMKLNNFDRFAVLSMMTRLRQICCDQRLVYENVTEPSSKLLGCMQLVENAVENKKKILIFSAFTSCLSLIEKELQDRNISYYVLTGDTSKDDRHELVEKFQSDDTSVFLISLKAGGVGLNLTAAEIVIHFDPWWNMSAQNQATDRAYRIGQDKNVQVYKLIMKDSIEEKILALQKKKMNLADTFVSGNEGSITSMSKEDIMDLFTID